MKAWFISHTKGGVNVSLVRDLVEAGLVLEHAELLDNPAMMRRQRFIYWPVTPADSPNLVHATFLRYLEDLTRAGLSVRLLVFDRYYGAITGRDEAAALRDAKLFVDALRRQGMSRVQHRVVYESRLLNSRIRGNALLGSLLGYFSALSKGSVDEIASYKHHLVEMSPFVRYIRPFLNMVYLSRTSSKYGFTLSGYDERAIWHAYHEYIGMKKEFRLTNLYIPTAHSLTGADTDVLDSEGSFTAADSKEEVRRKVELSLERGGSEGAALYALKYLVFGRGAKLEVRGPTFGIREFLSSEDVVHELRTADPLVRETIYNVVTEAIYTVMRTGRVSLPPTQNDSKDGKPSHWDLRT